MKYGDAADYALSISMIKLKSPQNCKQHGSICFRLLLSVAVDDQPCESSSPKSTQARDETGSFTTMRITELETPNQPPAKTIPKMKGKNERVSSFMDSWYQRYPWIHFCPERQAILCFHCARAYESGKAREQEEAFTHKGMKNWRKALQKCKDHDKSDLHIANLPASDRKVGSRLITEVISNAEQSAQEKAQTSLKSIITSIQFLAKQGLALRGHEADGGNFKELLRLRAEDSPQLREWLQRKENFTHHDIQNELLQIISHDVLREVVREVHGSGQDCFFSIIVDGTQDVSGTEQEAICIRYVDDEFQVREEFVGFYECSSTTGASLARMIEDGLCRLNLPLTGLRGMAFDGAANMSGCINGAQAILRQKQPSAMFVHCGAHCANLVAKESCDVSTVIKNALGVVNELGVLFNESGKLRENFKDVCTQSDVTHTRLRPLCPTRWTVRLRAVDAVLHQYEEIMMMLEELAEGSSHLSTRAGGLFAQLQQGSTVVALLLARSVIAPLDRLNRVTQDATCTVSAMLQCVEMTVEELKVQEQSSRTKVSECMKQAEKYGCEEVVVPRKRRRPTRMDDYVQKPGMKDVTQPPETHRPETKCDYLKNEYLRVLSTAVRQLQARFAQEGIRAHAQMEQLLLSAPQENAARQLLEKSPWASDLDAANLVPQLQVLFREVRPRSLSDALKVVQVLEKPALLMVPDAVKLLKLLLTLPASSATAERSFSALRRLKTWLRSTMTQRRLNAAAICHVHRDRVAKVDPARIATAFVQLNPGRKRVFGALQ